jgi:transposase InsO family protein
LNRLDPDKPGKLYSFDFAVIAPIVERSTYACANLFRSGKPFACLMHTTLIHRVPQLPDGTVDQEVRKRLDRAGKLVFSDAEMTWIIGNSDCTVHRCYHAKAHKFVAYGQQEAAQESRHLPRRVIARMDVPYSGEYCDNLLQGMMGIDATTQGPFHNHAQVFAAQLQLTLPGLVGGKLRPTVGTIAQWIAAQGKEIAELSLADRRRLTYRDSDHLAMFMEGNDVFGRVFVPVEHREALVKNTHESLLHLGHRKVYSHLRTAYWWPGMRANVENILKPCAPCLLTKHQQTRAHKAYRVSPATAPRTSLAFDFKGMSKSSNGFEQLCGSIDLCTKELTLWAQKTRRATETCQGVMDNIINVDGVPLTWHTDHAQELIGQVMTRYWKPYGTVCTTTRSYNASGNADIERCWRFINAAFRSLSDAQYKVWEKFVSSIRAAWNTTVCDSIETSPFEAGHGAPMRSPALAFVEAPPPEAQPLSKEMLRVVQESAASFQRAAQANATWFKHLRANKLNATGRHHDFKVGDRVRIYFPPSAQEARRRGRKVKHLCWYKGPLTITAKISNTGFTMKHSATGRVYERTLANMAPWHDGSELIEVPMVPKAQSPRAAPTHAIPAASTAGFAIGDLIAVKCNQFADRYWLQRVINVNDREIVGHIYGSFGRAPHLAKFFPVYVDARTDVKMTRPPPGQTKVSTRWTDVITAAIIPRAVIARGLQLNKSGSLSAASQRLLRQLPGTVVMASLNENF